MTVYRPDPEEMQNTTAAAKIIFLEAFSNTYRIYHQQSGSIESIENWLDLQSELTLEKWLCNVFDEEYEEYLEGKKEFIFLRNFHGDLLGWLTHSPVSEKGEVYLSQCSLEANSRNQKVTTTIFSNALKESCIKKIFPGVKVIKLITRKINTIAVHLYTKAGFIMDETIDPSVYGACYNDRYIGFRLVLDE